MDLLYFINTVSCFADKLNCFDKLPVFTDEHGLAPFLTRLWQIMLWHFLSCRHHNDSFVIREKDISTIPVKRYSDRKVRIPFHCNIYGCIEYGCIYIILHPHMDSYRVGKQIFFLIKPLCINTIFHSPSSISFRDHLAYNII